MVGTVVGSPEVGVITQFTATPNATGAWAATFNVRPNKPAGAYDVTAVCHTDPGQMDLGIALAGHAPESVEHGL